MGEDTNYGMARAIKRSTTSRVGRHGGSLFGYQSDIISLPDHGVGAVILTNADTGAYATGLFQRRLEVLFAGKPEALEQAKAVRVRHCASIAKTHERLVVPEGLASAGAPAYRPSRAGSCVRLVMRRSGLPGSRSAGCR